MLPTGLSQGKIERAVIFVGSAILLLAVAFSGSGEHAPASEDASSKHSFGPRHSEEEPQLAEMSRAPGDRYGSIASMLPKTELVVHGTVRSVGRGHAIGSDGILFTRDAVLRIEKVLFGQVPTEEIIVDQVGYIEGVPVEMAELPWVEPGDETILFLWEPPGRPDGHYSVAIVPGQLAVRDGVLHAFAPDAVSEILDGMPVQVFVRELHAAVSATDAKAELRR